jgi:hypothetical protein
MDNLWVDTPKPGGWRTWLAHAFAVDRYDESSLAPEEKALLTRMALEIHARGMATPAILYLNSNRHMGWLGSQVLVVTEPIYDIAHPFLSPLLKRFGLSLTPDEMTVLISAFEKRYTPEYFVQRIEAAQAGELTFVLETGKTLDPDPDK